MLFRSYRRNEVSAVYVRYGSWLDTLYRYRGGSRTCRYRLELDCFGCYSRVYRSGTDIHNDKERILCQKDK